MVKVSLIVLANGDEKNLDRCIDSLEKQDYEDKELICASITEVEWLKEHENIITLHKKVNSIEELRSYALDKATGDYIYFVDANDRIQDETITNAVQKMMSYTTELLISSYVTSSNGEFRYEIPESDVEEVTHINYLLYLRRYLTFRKLSGSLIKKSLLEKLSTDELSLSSQKVMGRLCLLSAKTIYTTSNDYIFHSDDHDAPIPEFDWEMYELSDVATIVAENREQDYQSKIPTKMSIALCVDERYQRYMDTLIYSIAKHTTREVDVYVFYNKLETSTLGRLNALGELLKLNIILKKIPAKIENLLEKISMENNHLPISAFYRIFLPQLLPNVERILYLDVDVLITNNLEELWNEDLQGAFFGCVRDEAVAATNGWGEQLLGPVGKDYFNSGVLLMDLSLFRKYSINLYFYQFILESTQFYVLGDQDALNLYFKGAVKYLDIKYNYVVKLLDEHPRPLNEITILHFLGPTKPLRNQVSMSASQYQAVKLYRSYRYEFNQKISIFHKFKISVIVTIKNGNEISKCLESILYQDYPDFEVVIIDGSSNDKTYQKINQLTSGYPNVKIKQVQSDDEMVLMREGILASEGSMIYFLNESANLSYEKVLTDLVLRKRAELIVASSMTLKNGDFYFVSQDSELVDISNLSVNATKQLLPKEFEKLSGILADSKLVKDIPNDVTKEQFVDQLVNNAESKQYWRNITWISIE